MPKMDSIPKIMAALEGSVCFCPMFCKRSAKAVHTTAKYKTDVTEDAFHITVLLFSKKKVVIHEKRAAKPN